MAGQTFSPWQRYLTFNYSSSYCIGEYWGIIYCGNIWKDGLEHNDLTLIKHSK